MGENGPRYIQNVSRELQFLRAAACEEGTDGDRGELEEKGLVVRANCRVDGNVPLGIVGSPIVIIAGDIVS